MKGYKVEIRYHFIVDTTAPSVRNPYDHFGRLIVLDDRLSVHPGPIAASGQFAGTYETFPFRKKRFV